MLPTASSLIEQALKIVEQSGGIIAEHNRKPRNVRLKGRIDLVTDTDLAVENFLREHLRALCPHGGFLAEEASPKQALEEMTWIIDPVDGTTNFAHRLPFVATSVALWLKGEIALGIVNMPLLGECFWAVKGQGAYCNGERIQVSTASQVHEALVATGFSYNIAEEADIVSQRLGRVLARAQGVRRCGAAAADLAYLAAGRYDVFYENSLKPWDVAAGWLLVEEAGGLLTRFDGSAYSLGAADLLAAGSSRLHDDMVEMLKD